MTQKRNDLSPVLWEGRQWAVTEYGLETISEPYHYYVEARLIGALRPTPIGDFDDALYDTPLHLVEKEWVDVDDMLAAWLMGSVLLGSGRLDAEMARITMMEARKLRRKLGLSLRRGDDAP